MFPCKVSFQQNTNFLEVLEFLFQIMVQMCTCTKGKQYLISDILLVRVILPFFPFSSINMKMLTAQIWKTQANYGAGYEITGKNKSQRTNLSH